MTFSNGPQSPTASPSTHRQPPSPTTAPMTSPRLSVPSTSDHRQPISEHRHSFSELRGVPPSPRSQRQPSLTQTALQDLLNHPPLSHRGSNAFAGRDWKRVKVGEVVDAAEVRWAELDTSVEEATKHLTLGAPNVVLVRPDAKAKSAIATFDYSDLNFYLLVVVGLMAPDAEHMHEYAGIAQRAAKQQPVRLAEVKALKHSDALVALPHTADLSKAVEIFGSGIHRILVTQEGGDDVLGILTQLRLVRFFWENHYGFADIENLFSHTLQDLRFGAKPVVAINGDRPLSEALQMMQSQSITSLPVLDDKNNVVGNISHVDVRLLTKTTSLPLLRQSCIHFISVILSERGMNDGKDSFPVFYISPFSSLAHTVAKLVATRSHRMWIVDAPSPSSSVPQTPAVAHPPTTPSSPTLAAPAPSAAGLPGQHMSGRLSGVISLTDVLNLFAKAGGLSPADPAEARRQRRRSSSSSLRASMDSARGSGLDLARSGSVSGRR